MTVSTMEAHQQHETLAGAEAATQVANDQRLDNLQAQVAEHQAAVLRNQERLAEPPSRAEASTNAASYAGSLACWSGPTYRFRQGLVKPQPYQQKPSGA